MNYNEATEKFSRARDKDKGYLLGKHTRLLKEGDAYKIRYHETDVITIYPDNYYEFKNGGWLRPTTKRRIEEFSPVEIEQTKNVWYLHSNNNVTRFFEGIRVDANGIVLNPMSEDKEERLKNKERFLDKIIKKYIDAFVKAIDNEELGYPSGSDCFYCLMKTEEGKTMGDCTNDSHIISHFKEAYLVPSLLANAIINSDYTLSVYNLIIKMKHSKLARLCLRKYFRDKRQSLLQLI